MVAISKTFREKDLQSMLLDLHDFKNRQFDLAYYNELFKGAILAFGSNTPDNLEAIEHISITIKEQEIGIQLISQKLSFKEIITSLGQSSKIYQSLQKELPDLTKLEWNAVINFVQLFLEDIKNPFGLTYRMKEIFENGEEERLTTNVLKKINDQTKLIVNTHYQKLKINNTTSIFNYIQFDFSKNKETNTKRYGIRLKEYIFLSDLFSILEEMSAPSFIGNQTSWEAFNRIMVLMLLAFEGNESIH